MAKFRVIQGKYHGTKDGQRHTYRPGDIVELDPDKVRHFQDIFEPLDPVEPEEERLAAPRLRLEIVHKGGGKYIVINAATNKPVNDKLLTKKQAQDLVMRELGEIDDGTNEEKPDSQNMAESDSVPARRRTKPE